MLSKWKIKLISIIVLFVLCAGSICIGLEQRKEDSRTYNVPTSEVAEKIEYIHKLDSMPDVSKLESDKENLELLIENNVLKKLVPDLDARVICIYEGEQEFDVTNYKFAIYKEDAEKNIIFVNMIFVEEGTEDVYTWEGDSLVQIGNMKQSEVKTDERYKSKSQINLLYENVELGYLLVMVAEVLEENVNENVNLIYDGTTEFLNRKYHVMSAFDDHETHIIRGQSYYLDMESGNLYVKKENAEFLRTELYYIGGICNK